LRRSAIAVIDRLNRLPEALIPRDVFGRPGRGDPEDRLGVAEVAARTAGAASVNADALAARRNRRLSITPAVRIEES
jgi:hypothetical protein